MKRRIGLLGGSFDPVHNAHLALGRQALTELQLDELRWVPVGHAWQKARPLTAAAHREAMLRLAIDGEPRFVLERCELQRPGPSYTLDTVRELQAHEPEAQWFLVIGQDQFASLHTWVGFEQLLPRVTLAVAQRPGTKIEADARVLAAPTGVDCRCRRWTSRPPTSAQRVAAGLDIVRAGAACRGALYSSTSPLPGHRRELNGHPQTAARHRRWPGRREGPASGGLQHRAPVSRCSSA